MATTPKQLLSVTHQMKLAGAAVLANRLDLPKEDLATEVYQAMVAAETGMPAHRSPPAQDEVAAASVLQTAML